GVGACHAGQLDDGGHAAGTTTRWPARRPSPETWTSPPALSNRPSSTVTRWLSPPVSSTSTAYSLPARARRAVTGTVSTSSTVSVVIATSTGAWSRPAAVPGSVRAARTGTVAEPLSCWVATAPTSVTVPDAVVRSGRVTATASPTLT